LRQNVPRLVGHNLFVIGDTLNRGHVIEPEPDVIDLGVRRARVLCPQGVLVPKVRIASERIEQWNEVNPLCDLLEVSHCEVRL
jgi:hypothetical protein